jgi:NAD(P)H dehydrogenase (quinone)
MHVQQLKRVRLYELSTLLRFISHMVKDMEWAEHFTFIYPVWWGTYPVALKAFIDRVFLSGVAFKYGKTGTKWEKLWSGKTARLIFTMDAPTWWYKLFYRAPAENSLRWATLWYVGIKTTGITRFTPIRFSTPEIREKWLAKAASLGTKDAK